LVASGLQIADFAGAGTIEGPWLADDRAMMFAKPEDAEYIDFDLKPIG
jgi:hypothetical protein